MKGSIAGLKKCILRLGEFHVCMRLLRSISHFMQRKELTSIFDIIYVESTVPHSLHGETVSRETTDHLILLSCLVSFSSLEAVRV